MVGTSAIPQNLEGTKSLKVTEIWFNASLTAALPDGRPDRDDNTPPALRPGGVKTLDGQTEWTIHKPSITQFFFSIHIEKLSNNSNVLKFPICMK